MKQIPSSNQQTEEAEKERAIKIQKPSRRGLFGPAVLFLAFPLIPTLLTRWCFVPSPLACRILIPASTIHRPPSTSPPCLTLCSTHLSFRCSDALLFLHSTTATPNTGMKRLSNLLLIGSGFPQHPNLLRLSALTNRPRRMWPGGRTICSSQNRNESPSHATCSGDANRSFVGGLK